MVLVGSGMKMGKRILTLDITWVLIIGLIMVLEVITNGRMTGATSIMLVMMAA